MTDIISKAMGIAAMAHRGQKDKAGEAYLLHPLRVASMMTTEEEIATALLHDVVEDSIYTLNDLKLAGLPESVIRAVDLLTRKKGQSYKNYVLRLKTDPLARKVKIEDLRHNMDLSRLPKVKSADLKRLEQYREALQILLDP